MNKEERTSMQELVQYRERLIRQKQFLTDILSQIEKQILALQVERMHLKNALLGTEYSRRKTSDTLTKVKDIKVEVIINDDNSKDLMEQKLDLTVPPQNDFEEEIEDDDITENEKQILNQLDVII